MIGGANGPLIENWGPTGERAALVDGKVFDPKVMGRLWGYLRDYKPKLIWTLGLVVITSTMQLIGPYLLKVAIDNYIVARTDLTGLSLISLAYALTLVVSYFSQANQSNTMAYVTQHVLSRMRTELLIKINRLPLGYHDVHESGITLSRIINDVAVFQELLTQGAVNVVADALILIGIVTIMVAMSPKLAALTLAVMPIMVLSTAFFTAHARKAYLQTRETIGEVAAGFQENVSAVRVVQAFTREGANEKKFDRVNQGNLDANLLAVRLASAFPPVVELMGMIATSVVLWYGTESVLSGEITVGVVVAFLTYVTRFFQPIREIAQVYTLFQQAMAAGEKIFDLLDQPIAVDDRPDARVMPPIEGAIDFDHVFFNYREDVPVLKDVSLRADPGQTIALVGPTGAGKTSIASLLARFYDISGGAIRIDGIDIRDVTMASLRSQMGLVPQDPFLFSGSIAENIRFGRLDATDEEIMDAAKLANAHEFIERLPEGYETEVNERGQNYSQGQRQLIAFARAVLANPRILILDEATASVDTRTEVLIQSALGKLLHGRTSVVIAHRLSTIRNADEVLVVNGGQIVQQGTHRELLSEEGMYRDLYLMQYRREARKADLIPEELAPSL